MSSNEKYGVVVFSIDLGQLFGARKLGFYGFVLQELDGMRISKILNAFFVDRRIRPRCGGEIDFGVGRKNIVRVRSFG